MWRPAGLTDIDSFIICNGKENLVYYSQKKDSQLTALAATHKRKILTERVVSVEGGKKPIAVAITKVILL
jgi:hypothetical protein